ncbi:hypothetical protein [Pedobacter aquatilis]|uniref:hypothetical protein n=1 Tax=Pedobacter aquatilis TaxID=351343 RepID=UPI00292EBFE9|nr:hypothetical protein [Pedobacter aquatilis]
MKSYFSLRCLLFFISFSLTACSEKAKDLNHAEVHKYIGLRKADTTKLSIRIAGDDFYGTMEVIYAVGMKDSGDVKGKLYGDTIFMGDYYHMHDGQEKWRRDPLRLVKRKGKLIRGEGLVGYFANIPFFVSYPPVEYDEKKQFVLFPIKQ